MRTETEIRDAFARLAHDAPPASVLDQSRWIETADSDELSGRRASRARIGRGKAVAAVGATVAAVVLVVAGAIALSGRPKSETAPPTIWNVTPPGYPTRYLFGPSSLPGFELAYAHLRPTTQSFVFDTPGRPFDYLAMELDVYTPTAAARRVMTGMTPVGVGTANGFYGTGRVTGPGPIQAIFGSTPAAKYVGSKVPEESVVTWPIGDGRWAAITPMYDTKEHGPSSQDQTMPQHELARYASSLRPSRADRAAPVRVGYLPQGSRLLVADANPRTHSTPSQVPPAGQNDRTNLVSAQDGTSGASEFELDFVGAYGAQLSIDVVGEPLHPLHGASNAKPPALIYPGPWRRTTINGHLAWVSPRDVLVQWGSVQVGVSTVQDPNAHSRGLVPESELIKVAKSLTVPEDVGFFAGYPLLTAVPAGALS